MDRLAPNKMHAWAEIMCTIIKFVLCAVYPNDDAAGPCAKGTSMDSEVYVLMCTLNQLAVFAFKKR